MATKVHMEALSPTMEEGRLVTWLKQEGEKVEEGELLAEIETDKATMELVARGSGVLVKRMIGDGETAPVGSIIAIIAAEGEDVSKLVGEVPTSANGPRHAAPSPVPETASPEGRQVAEGAASLAASDKSEQHQGVTGVQASADSPDRRRTPAAGTPMDRAEGGRAERAQVPIGEGRLKASPLARRIAAEAGVELAAVQGTGPGGRITRRDIEAVMEEPRQAPSTPTPAATEAAMAEVEEVPVSQMRKTIARRLASSIGPIPTFYLTIDVDMRRMLAVRESVNRRLADRGGKASINDFLIKAVAAALIRHPEVNASWAETSIRRYGRAHIGVAVAVEDGLITPVIRDADRKGVAHIAAEIRELAGRGREKKLKPEEYTGATFSISNLGMFGIEEFTAIINPPEAAILAVGAVEERAVVENGQVVARPRMRMTMSCDHRVIDGATGARFLQTLKDFVEEPVMMMT